MAATRVYIVRETDKKGAVVAEALVRAGSQAQSITHVVKGRFDAEVASQDDLVRLVAAHHVVADAGAE